METEKDNGSAISLLWWTADRQLDYTDSSGTLIGDYGTRRVAIDVCYHLRRHKLIDVLLRPAAEDCAGRGESGKMEFIHGE
jgi:hypothetical protein